MPEEACLGALHVINRSEGVLAPGTAYVIPARVGVWLPGGCFLGSDVRLGFVVFCCLVVLLSCCRSRAGSVFFEVRFRGRGPRGCVLLTEIYKMSRRT